MAAAACATIAGAVSAGPGEEAAPTVYTDRAADAVARPSDPEMLPFDPDLHHLPDLLAIRIGAWEPAEPAVDLYDGEFQSDESEADFVRIELLFRGLMNPPGSADPDHFDPFAYGPDPIFGVLEIDMDQDADTGGELDAPEFRFLGNAARFGGAPSSSRFGDRFAIDYSAFDGNVTTKPWVDRSGEEFHLAFFGTEFANSAITIEAGDVDHIFESGETWRLRGQFFHRAHGYEPLSLMKGGQHPGEYMPESDLLFSHDLASGNTTISLVFPLTQYGAAQAAGEPPEPANEDPTDQASVLEGLADLQFSAEFLQKFPSGDPREVLITRWASRDPTEQLEPHDWRVNGLFGSAYSAPSPTGVYYVWSDVYPDVRLGDVTGDGEFDDDDTERTEDFIVAHDAQDGMVDETVPVAGFARNFSLFDANYDGVVDGLDLIAGEADGDADDDEDIDLRDFARLQVCFQADPMVRPECRVSDVDLDAQIEVGDFIKLVEWWNGP